MINESLEKQQEIAREIERIKSQFDETREVYRQVCRLLFLEYGITPTANGLYQLVRKGSMGTPGAVVREFWQEIRAAARIRIDRADMSPELLKLAADMVGTLWERAIADADAGMDLERGQLGVERAQAEADVAQAREEVQRKQAEVVRVEAELATARSEIRLVESRLAAALEGRKNLEQEVAGLREEMRLRDEALDRARKDFAAELAASREQAQLAAERSEEAARRSVLEIDRARTAGATIQRSLDELRQRSADTEAALREEVERGLREVSHERHRIGVLEGELALWQSESRSRSTRQRSNDTLVANNPLPLPRRISNRTAIRGRAPRRG